MSETEGKKPRIEGTEDYLDLEAFIKQLEVQGYQVGTSAPGMIGYQKVDSDLKQHTRVVITQKTPKEAEVVVFTKHQNHEKWAPILAFDLERRERRRIVLPHEIR